MSVLKKMENTLDTEKYLSNIYNKLKRDMLQNTKLSSEDLKAKKLQAFLRLIKSAEQNNNKLSLSKFWPASDQISLIQELQEINPTLFREGLMLKTQHTNLTQLGNYLEHDLARIFKTFEASLTGKDYKSTQKTYGIGSRRTQIPNIIQDAEEIMLKEYKEAYRSAARGMEEYKNTSQPISDSIGVMHSVQGKADVQGLNPAILTLSTQTTIKKDIRDALLNASFSAKNYISSNDINLGQTNPFRVFSTAASAIGVDGGPDRYYRMINCLINHNNSPHSNAPSYFYRIRGIYELTGAKMQYVKQDSLGQLISGQYVKFLVINNPSGEVYVISTARIVKNLIDKAFELMPGDWKTALNGPIKIPQIDLQNLT